MQEVKAKELMDSFKPFFESAKIKKVWHNYSFDRHVLANMGIHCQGFEGDTVHMARLNDSSRKGKLNYSLASLTGCVPPLHACPAALQILLLLEMCQQCNIC